MEELNTHPFLLINADDMASSMSSSIIIDSVKFNAPMLEVASVADEYECAFAVGSIEKTRVFSARMRPPQLSGPALQMIRRNHPSATDDDVHMLSGQKVFILRRKRNGGDVVDDVLVLHGPFVVDCVRTEGFYESSGVHLLDPPPDLIGQGINLSRVMVRSS